MLQQDAMSIASLRTAVTTAGGTPVGFTQHDLYRELITAWGGTPTQHSTVGLLREAITTVGGTPTQFAIMPLLRELVTALGGTPETYQPDALEVQVAANASLGPNLGPELIQNGTGAATTGWSVGFGSLTATGSALRVSTSGFGQVVQQVSTLEPFHTYRLTATFAPQSGNYGQVGDTVGVDLYLSVDGSPASIDFVAGSTNKNIYLQTRNGAGTWQPSGEYVDFTVSLREVL